MTTIASTCQTVAGAAHCPLCGQFAGAGHVCPASSSLGEAAVTIFGSESVRKARRACTAQPDGPAPRAAAEAALTGLGIAAEREAVSGTLSQAGAQQARNHLARGWVGLQRGDRIGSREVAALAALSRGPAGPDAPSPAEAESELRRSKVALGVATLRNRSRPDPVGLAAARARCQSALREVHRAQSLAAAQPGRKDGPPAPSAGRCPDCGQFAGPGHVCPVPEGLPAGEYAGMKGDARVKAMLADLETSVAAIVESGQLQRWLDAMASNGLSRWSANNRILAAVQMLQRGASLEDLHMMGFRQWSSLDRQVIKGAKAVWILAPVTRKVLDEADDGTITERPRVIGFKSVPVFDISDTQGAPLPPAPLRPAPGAATPGTLEGLRDRVGRAGYAYGEVEIPGCRPATGEGTLGYTDPKSKRIVVDARLSEAQKASTIAHELGHVHCGHVDTDYSEYQRHRGQMETEAEAVAFMVCRRRGASPHQTEAFSPGYIAYWSKGDPSVMHRALDRAVQAQNKIMDGDWPAGQAS